MQKVTEVAILDKLPELATPHLDALSNCTVMFVYALQVKRVTAEDLWD